MGLPPTGEGVTTDTEVDRPPPGETVPIAVQVQKRYVLTDDLTGAEPRIVGDDLVIVFEPDGGRIVFEDLAAMARAGKSVTLIIDGKGYPSDKFVKEVQIAAGLEEVLPGEGKQDEDGGKNEDEKENGPQGEGSTSESNVAVATILAALKAQGAIEYLEGSLGTVRVDGSTNLRLTFLTPSQESDASVGGARTPDVGDPVGFAGTPAEDTETEFALSAATFPDDDPDLVVVQVSLDLPFQVVGADENGAFLAAARGDGDTWTIDLAKLAEIFGVPMSAPEPGEPPPDGAPRSGPQGLVESWTLDDTADPVTGAVTSRLVIRLNEDPSVTDPALSPNRNRFEATLELTPPRNSGGDIQDAVSSSISLNVVNRLESPADPDQVPFENLGVTLALDPHEVSLVLLLVEPGVTLDLAALTRQPDRVEEQSNGPDGPTLYTFEFPSAFDATDTRPLDFQGLLRNPEVDDLIRSFSFLPEIPPGNDDRVGFEILTRGLLFGAGSEVVDIVLDDVVDGSELLLDGDVIEAGASIVGDDTGPTALALTLTLDRDSTSIAGPTPDADAPFTQGDGDEDGSERVTQIVVTLSVAEGALPMLVFEAPDPTEIVVDEPDGIVVGSTIAWTFNVLNGADQSDVTDLIESFSVKRGDPTSTEDIEVTIETTTREIESEVVPGDQRGSPSQDRTNGLALTDPGTENPDNNEDVDTYRVTIAFADAGDTPLAGDDFGDVAEDTNPDGSFIEPPPSSEGNLLDNDDFGAVGRGDPPILDVQFISGVPPGDVTRTPANGADGDGKVVFQYRDGGAGPVVWELTAFTLASGDKQAGDYLFELLDPFDHGGPGDDETVSLAFGYRIEDANGGSDVGRLTIEIDDDVPMAVDDVEMLAVSPRSFSLLFDIDVSSSMGFAFDGGENPEPGESRLEIAVEAIKSTLAAVLERGDAEGLTASFQPFNHGFPLSGDRAPASFDDFVGYTATGTNAINTYLDGLFTGGATQFEPVIGGAADHFDVPDNQRDANILFFVSDGGDNDGFDPTAVDLQSLYDGSIPNFEIFAIGVGDPGASNVELDDLNAVVTGESGAEGTISDNVVLVTDPSKVGDALLDSIPSAPTLIANLLGNDSEGADGAVVSEVEEVAIPSGETLSLDGAFGRLEVSADGSYRYTISEPLPQNSVEEVFEYRITDGDGDSSSARLSIEISVPQAALVAHDPLDGPGEPGGGAAAAPFGSAFSIDDGNDDAPLGLILDTGPSAAGASLHGVAGDAALVGVHDADILVFDPSGDTGGEHAGDSDKTADRVTLGAVLDSSGDAVDIDDVDVAFAATGDGAAGQAAGFDNDARIALQGAGDGTGLQTSLFDLVNAVQIDLS